MFNWFKSDPVVKLRKLYDQKLEQGMLAQRSGNLRLFADITAEAEAIWQQILAEEAKKAQANTLK